MRRILPRNRGFVIRVAADKRFHIPVKLSDGGRGQHLQRYEEALCGVFVDYDAQLVSWKWCKACKATQDRRAQALQVWQNIRNIDTNNDKKLPSWVLRRAQPVNVSVVTQRFEPSPIIENNVTIPTKEPLT